MNNDEGSMYLVRTISSFLISILLLVAVSAYAEEADANKILFLSSKGIHPQTLELSRSGNSVFFLNETETSLVSIDIDYGKKKAFCASGTMNMLENGHFVSRSPISPRGFVTACFPEAGNYTLTVYGLPGKEKHTALIHVNK